MLTNYVIQQLLILILWASIFFRRNNREYVKVLTVSVKKIGILQINFEIM